MAALVEFSHVTKQYGAKTALDDVSFMEGTEGMLELG